MKLYVVGAGTPTPTEQQFGTSFVLQLDEDYLMFDCGPAATHKLVKMGLFPTQIDNLFLTHHHYDHNADYPCFLLCRWNHMTPQVRELNVWGPQPTTWFTQRLIGEDGAFSPDWKVRSGHPASQLHYADRGGTLPRPAPSVNVHDIGPPLPPPPPQLSPDSPPPEFSLINVTEQHGWRVTASTARHGEPWMRSLAYRVDSDVGSIVFAVDTGPCASVTRLAQGADVLVISLWDHQAAINRHWDEVRAAFPDSPIRTMMGTTDAAIMAQECGVNKLIVTHAIENLMNSQEKGIRDMARIYEGEIIFGQELNVLPIDRKSH